MSRALTVAELAATPVGQELGISGWMTISQARVDEFARATDDHQWLHTDPERAAEGPFGTTIAHGYLVLSLIPRLLTDVVELVDRTRGVNYGIGSLRFTSPVPTECSIRLRAVLSHAEWRGDGGLRYELRCEVEVEGQSRPALVGDIVLLAYND